MPDSFRARLLLWRDLAIHLLYRRRFEAITLGLQQDVAPQLDLTTFAGEHAALVAKTITNVYHQCPTVKHPDFVKRWTYRGVFLQERHGALVFHTMSTSTAQLTN